VLPRGLNLGCRTEEFSQIYNLFPRNLPVASLWRSYLGINFFTRGQILDLVKKNLQGVSNIPVASDLTEHSAMLMSTPKSLRKWNEKIHSDVNHHNKFVSNFNGANETTASFSAVAMKPLKRFPRFQWHRWNLLFDTAEILNRHFEFISSYKGKTLNKYFMGKYPYNIYR
jgi:hypothetical protein